MRRAHQSSNPYADVSEQQSVVGKHAAPRLQPHPQPDTSQKPLSEHNAMPFCLTRDDPKAAGVVCRRLALLLQPCRHVIQPLQAAPA